MAWPLRGHPVPRVQELIVLVYEGVLAFLSLFCAQSNDTQAFVNCKAEASFIVLASPFKFHLLDVGANSAESNCPRMSVPLEPPIRWILGTPLRLTSYADFTAFCRELAKRERTFSVDFSNTQIVTMRRHEQWFRDLTSEVDFFIPDGMPLIWCLNLGGAKLRDRVYGPTFMRECILGSGQTCTHYFLGGSSGCLKGLEDAFLQKAPGLKIIGKHHGYFGIQEEEGIIEEINRLKPDFIWVGLGTPKQQEWIRRNHKRIHRGVIFAVGFAFDVNAGTKQDAPMWMQRFGLTWVFRMASEPRRLVKRYFRYNSLFLFYLIWDSLRGRLSAAR